MEVTRDARILYVFDFDHTIVDGNSDTEILSMLGKRSLPEEVRAFFDGTNWTAYMNKIFEHLHSSGVGAQDILRYVSGLRPTEGMVQLLQLIQQKKSQEDKKGHHHLVIISDANQLFISSFLQGIDVSADTVITNRAEIDADGKLFLEPYENQTKCPICPRNLCKGNALEEYIKQGKLEGRPFTTVLYVGDGRNDACPASCLGDHDMVFAREEFSLEKILKSGVMKVRGENKELMDVPVIVSAKAYFWKHADSITEIVMSL